MAAAGVVDDLDPAGASSRLRTAGSAGPQARRGAAARVRPRERRRSSTPASTDLPRWLSAGDLLVVNASGTLNAALAATTGDGEALRAAPVDATAGRFLDRGGACARTPGVAALPSRRGLAPRSGLPAGGRATLLAPYPLVGALESTLAAVAGRAVELPDAVRAVSRALRRPDSVRLRDAAVAERRCTRPSSPPSPAAPRCHRRAGPFTPDLVTRLVSRGRADCAARCCTPASPASRITSRPYEEFYRVPRETADRVNAAPTRRPRVVAVGTTVVRALETVTDERGHLSPARVDESRDHARRPLRA